MKKTFNKILILLIFLTISISQTGCSGKANTPVTRDSFLLNTVCRIMVYSVETDEKDVEAYANNVIESTFSYISSLENILSKTVEGSDVFKINNAKGKEVEVNKETFEVISLGLEFYDISSGMFDISIGRETSLWDFHSDSHTGTIPDASELSDAASHVDASKVSVVGLERGFIISLSDPEMQLDLGGIAKGYIADRAKEYMIERGVTSAIINLGGNIVLIGGKESKLLHDEKNSVSDFAIGINNPDEKSNEVLDVISGSDLTVVTSGTYERYISVSGKKYHHILDPKTGYPVDTDLLQVSVISKSRSSAFCDSLSTTLLALGREKAEEVLVGYSDVKAIMVLNDLSVKTFGNIL